MKAELARLIEDAASEGRLLRLPDDPPSPVTYVCTQQAGRLIVFLVNHAAEIRDALP